MPVPYNTRFLFFREKLLAQFGVALGAGAQALPFAALADGGKLLGGERGDALVDFGQGISMPVLDFQRALGPVVEFFSRDATWSQMFRGALCFAVWTNPANIVKPRAQDDGFNAFGFH
jgi:hypothetical protein